MGANGIGMLKAVPVPKGMSLIMEEGYDRTLRAEAGEREIRRGYRMALIIAWLMIAVGAYLSREPLMALFGF